MKNCFFAVLILLCATSQAQYKKASFLNKKGRTYEFSGTGHFITEGHATIPGLTYSVGRQHEEKRTFHWFDFEFLLPSKFNYATEDYETSTPVSVNGKSSLGFVFRYNFAYFLADNSNEENKLLPFVTAGAGTSFGGPEPIDVMNTPGEYYDLKKVPVSHDFNLGLNLGVGLVYRITPVFGLKVAGGYALQLNADATGSSAEGRSKYDVYSSHPYGTLGIRFTMPQRD